MIFDPKTGKVIDPSSLRSIKFNSKGTTTPRSYVKNGNKVTETLNDKGRVDGFYTEHPSGRIDCSVFAETVSMKLEG